MNKIGSNLMKHRFDRAKIPLYMCFDFGKMQFRVLRHSPSVIAGLVPVYRAARFRRLNVGH